MSRLLFLQLIFFSALAQANVIGNDTQNFNPTTSGLDFVTVHGSEVLDPGVGNFGYFINNAYNVLPETVDKTGKTIKSKDEILAHDFSFGYGMTDRLEMGVNISYLLSQKTDRNEPGAQFSKTVLNELRANVKYQFVDRAPYGLAAIFSTGFNQVKNNPFLGKDAQPTMNFEVAVDRAWEKNLVALNLGYRMRNKTEPLDDAVYSPIPSQYLASIGYSRYFTDYDTKLIAEIYSAKSEVTAETKESQNLATEFLLGAKYDRTPELALHAGAGMKVHDGLFTPDYRLYLGLNYAFELYRRPKASSPAVQVEAPKEQTNKTATTVYQGFLPSDIEKLTNVSFDDIASKHEFKLNRELKDDSSQSEKPPFEIVRLDGLDFPFGSSELQAKHVPLMKRLLKYLQTDPPVIKLRIEGHTDSVGSEERNRLRSEGRTETIKKYLKEHGLNPSIQVENVGYGSSKPIADNSNFQGRALNRRVEVRILRKIHEPKEILRFEKVEKKPN